MRNSNGIYGGYKSDETGKRAGIASGVVGRPAVFETLQAEPAGAVQYLHSCSGIAPAVRAVCLTGLMRPSHLPHIRVTESVGTKIVFPSVMIYAFWFTAEPWRRTLDFTW
jgi:hypothetical protein